MSYYVYIIQSALDESYYKGYSEHPGKRLQQHNAGETHSTRHLIPWKLLYVEEMPGKTAAIRREKNLKKASRERIQALLAHPKNIARHFTQ